MAPLSNRKWTSDIKCMCCLAEKKAQLFSHLVLLQPQYTEIATLPYDIEGNCVPSMPILLEE